jgi:hypothetical protein
MLTDIPTTWKQLEGYDFVLDYVKGYFAGTMEPTIIFWFTDGGLFFQGDSTDLISDKVRNILLDCWRVNKY